jgi:hypothetical protein
MLTGQIYPKTISKRNSANEKRRSEMLRSHFMIVFAMTFLSLQLVNAQVSAAFDKPLSKGEAKETVKRAEDALEDAELAQSRGDTIRMEHALERYSNHINRLERELQEGNVFHDEHEGVAEILAQATSKHMDTLEELKGKVPSQAQEGINRAYAASQSGYDTALENLSEKRREELHKDVRG